MTRAKFKLDQVQIVNRAIRVRDENGNYKKSESGADVYETRELHTLIFSPVYSNNPQSENSKFWDASPSGSIQLGTVNPEAWGMFELDKEYYIDFTPAQ